jgi:NADPH:quinone reductase-like Zn-dependent oxidoreductase
MKAAICRKYGPPEVVRIQQVDKPTPSEGEVLVRTLATTISSADMRVRSLNVPAGFGMFMRPALGLLGPRQPILGSELAGVIESVGKNVNRLKVGDAVFAFSDTALGCHAEYRCLVESSVLPKPVGLTFEEAAALSFGGTTALAFLKKGRLQCGESILVNGASGSVGTAILQLAKHCGAIVTGVCSAGNAELVRSLGASHVIDYNQTDFTRNGKSYDVIVDAFGSAPFSRCQGSLSKEGRLLLIAASLFDMLRAPWDTIISGKRVIAGPASISADDLHVLAGLAAAGKYKPVIDRKFHFDQIVDAHRYVDTGRKRGNVVINVGQNTHTSDKEMPKRMGGPHFVGT